VKNPVKVSSFIPINTFFKVNSVMVKGMDKEFYTYFIPPIKAFILDSL